MKPKSKQEMAEFLCTKILSQYCNDRFINDYEYVNFIYSPEGFFAVWDAVEREMEDLCFIQFNKNEEECWIEYIFKSGPKAKGKDRYEAFYNAVWEVYKEKSEHS
jgi:hypothetical protein